MKVISVSITDEQAARLKGEQLKSGAPVSLQVRRALDAAVKVRRVAQSTEQQLFPDTTEERRQAALKRQQELTELALSREDSLLGCGIQKADQQ